MTTTSTTTTTTQTSGLQTTGTTTPTTGTSSGSTVTNPAVPTNTTGTTTPTPVDGYGGDATVILPKITGVSNQDNSLGTIPEVVGDGYKIFPCLAARPYEWQDGSTSHLLALFDCGYGQLDLKTPQIGGKDVNTTNFPTAKLDYRYGQIGEQPFTGFAQETFPTYVGLPLASGVPQLYTANYAGTYLAVDIVFPNGLFKRTYAKVNGVTKTTYSSSSCTVRLRYRAHGDTAWNTTTRTFSASSPATYTGTFSVTTLAKAAYDIEVTKITADAPFPDQETNACQVGTVYVQASMAAFPPIYDRLQNPVYMARVQLSATADDNLNGTVDNLSFIASRYLRHWNGTTYLLPSITANPADIYLNMLNGPACFEPLLDSEIDMAAILDWWNYCNDNGFKYVGVFDSSDSQQNWMAKVCAAGRAYPMAINGLQSIRVDKPNSTISQLFTSRSIIEGSFSARATFARPLTFVRVQFINKATWTMDVRDVYDDGYRQGAQPDTWQVLQFDGCVDATLAYKYGRYQLTATRARPWAYTFAVDIESLLCQVGNRCKLNHDAIYAGLGCGRLAEQNPFVLDGSGNITGFHVDSDQTMDGVSNVGILLQYSADGSIAELPIVNVAGTTKTLTLKTPIPASQTPFPRAGDKFAYGLIGKEALDIQITDIQYMDDMTATITAIDYVEAVYSADTMPVPDYVSPISFNHPTVVNVPIPSYVNIRSDESVLVRALDGSLQARVLIAMNPQPISVSEFESQYAIAGSNAWSVSQLTNTGGSSSIVLSGNDLQGGQNYDIRIRNRTSNDDVSDWLNITNYFVIGKTSPPPDVPNTVTIEDTLVRWFYDSDHGVTIPLDFSGFRVKLNWGDDSNWAHANVICDQTGSTAFDIGGLARGLKTIMIKAVDTSGNEQAGPAAEIKLDFGDADFTNQILSFDEAPLFSGTISGGTVTGGKLLPNDDGTLLWGDSDLSPLWDGADNSVLWGNTYVPMTYIWQVFIPVTTAAPFTIRIDESGINATSYKLEYMAPDNTLLWGATPTSDLDPLWGGADTDPLWGTNTQPFILMPTNGIDGAFGTYTFRLTTYQSLVQAVISHLKVLIGLPQKLESVNNLLIPATGLRVPLKQSYYEIDGVRIQLLSNVAYPGVSSAQVVDKSIVGPLIQLYDVTNNPIAGLVDVDIEGY